MENKLIAEQYQEWFKIFRHDFCRRCEISHICKHYFTCHIVINNALICMLNEGTDYVITKGKEHRYKYEFKFNDGSSLKIESDKDKEELSKL